ncbi:MAG: B12-binding domain-containing radical SAM protein, partial [Desulfobacterium sp.]|nr:B12-binding domain-containing radical SAM protein [Desulfobacterium sp.]
MKVLVLNPASSNSPNVVRDQIFGCWCKGKEIGGMQMPPLSLLYVATVLQNAGHDVVFIDGAAERQRFLALLEHGCDADVIIASTSTMTVNEDAQTLGKIRHNGSGDRPINMVFGTPPTFLPRETLTRLGIDIAIMGDPEDIVIDLLNEMSLGGESWKSVQGIAFRDNGGVVVNNMRPIDPNLDRLSYPNRSFLPDHDYFNPVVKRYPYTVAMTSRGCSGKCIFCTVPRLYQNVIQVRTAENVLGELELILEQGYREVIFRDETFTMFKKRNETLCKEIIRRSWKISWICNGRLTGIDKPMLALMQKAGCHMIKFGVESGDQGILDTMKKGTTLEEIRRIFRWCNELGLDAHAHVMLGNVGETYETIERTIEFVKKLNPANAAFGILTPYPGTELFDRVARIRPEINDGSQCDLKCLHTAKFFNETFTHIDSDALENWMKIAYRRFYWRPGYL